MSIPLDRLYHFIEKVFEKAHGDNVIIYRFFPHGSKKFTDLNPLKKMSLTWKQKKLLPQIFCNDQEPLNYELYEHIPEDQIEYNPILDNIAKHGLVIPKKNFRTDTFTIWDCALLLHSERRSSQVTQYQNNDFLPVYYWSHALIARDWFRYAEHIEQNKKTKKTFLIYARGWSGTREYRLKFLDLLIHNNLHDHVATNVQPVDAETAIHYSQHQFRNLEWKPDIDLEQYLLTNNTSSDSSADFDLEDYENTEIEVVLETLFDDTRLHFTEKILRPIALGQPFILMGAQGGLEYLKSYGFQTFAEFWSEEYDSIVDPRQRMCAVMDLMKQIINLDPDKKIKLMQDIKHVVDYNKKRFFSRDFFQQVVMELESNVAHAINELKTTNIGQTWYDIRQQFVDNEIVQKELWKVRSQQENDEVFNVLLEYRQKNLNKQ